MRIDGSTLGPLSLLLVLSAAGCASEVGAPAAGYVLLDREARVAGVELRIDGIAVPDVLPAAVRDESVVTLVIDGAAEVLSVEPGELVLVRGAGPLIEPFAIGGEVSADHLVIDAGAVAAALLAGEIGAEVGERVDGAHEIFAPDIFSLAAAVDAPGGVAQVLPAAVDPAVAEALGLPALAFRLGDEVAGGAGGEGSLEGLGTTGGLDFGGLVARGAVAGDAAEIEGRDGRPIPLTPGGAALAVPDLVGVYQNGDARVTVDTDGEASLETGGRSTWGCRIPLRFDRDRVVIVPEGAPTIELTPLDDGSIALDGRTFRRATAGEP